MENLNFLLPLASSNDAAAAAAAGGMMVFYVIFGIAFYLIMGFAMMTIANKLGEENGWWGFIPILNLILLVKLAQKEMWSVILFFIPCANILALIITWMAI